MILEKCIIGKLPICQSYDNLSGHSKSQKLYTGKNRNVKNLKNKTKCENIYISIHNISYIIYTYYASVDYNGNILLQEKQIGTLRVF